MGAQAYNLSLYFLPGPTFSTTGNTDVLCQWVALQDKPSFSAMEGTSLLVQKASLTQPELDHNRVVQHVAPNTNAVVAGLLPLLDRKGTHYLTLLKDLLAFDKSTLFRQKAVPRSNRPISSALKSMFVSGNTNVNSIPSKRKQATRFLFPKMV